MKKSILISCLLIFALSEAHTQTVYVDALVAPAMVVYAQALKEQQNDAVSNLKEIRNAQILVQGQLKIANNLHNKFLKGLREVSGTVKNALTIKRIYETSSDIINELQEAIQIAREHPEYAVFAVRASNNFKQRALQLSSDVTRITAGGDSNLMDSGERQRLLLSVHRDLKLIWGTVYAMSRSIKTAVQAGFWRRINPFQRWVNEDARLMRNILKEAASNQT
ncbi:hypothetical protein [Sphingobacterium siyangense]|uniref:hypothetical protein n=1 Tax=Sphingobacterium siyangense TaxID=459529 RepID=UPI00289EF144|nr:hypothetical protein [Sphingobacterium siyangense]